MTGLFDVLRDFLGQRPISGSAQGDRQRHTQVFFDEIPKRRFRTGLDKYPQQRRVRSGFIFAFALGHNHIL